jgi:glycosyltransferase involved in cell wall biosynthesis
VFGIQVANEINGFGPDEAEGRGGAIGAARIAVERLKFRSSKLLVAVSPFLAGRYAGYYGINPGKFRIVDNGVAEHFFKPADGTRVRQKFGFAADDFALGYVGSFNPDHDFETMLAVIGKLKAKGRKVRGLFCGKGARLEEARETAKHLGVENEVSFPGPIPYEEVPEYLAAFDCAAILMEPRRAGALASVMKLKEYLAAGVPVLSSDFTGDDAGLSEFVFQGGIRDEEKAANTAERIAADREGAREKARRGREFVRGRFSWRNTARQYEDALFGRAACGKPAACARRKP